MPDNPAGYPKSAKKDPAQLYSILGLARICFFAGCRISGQNIRHALPRHFLAGCQIIPACRISGLTLFSKFATLGLGCVHQIPIIWHFMDDLHKMCKITDHNIAPWITTDRNQILKLKNVGTKYMWVKINQLKMNLA